MASSSIPGIFPPTHYHDMVLMDGGTIDDVNIVAAINECHDLGFTDETKIIIDVCICGPGYDASFKPSADAL